MRISPLNPYMAVTKIMCVTSQGGVGVCVQWAALEDNQSGLLWRNIQRPRLQFKSTDLDISLAIFIQL